MVIQVRVQGEVDGRVGEERLESGSGWPKSMGAADEPHDVCAGEDKLDRPPVNLDVRKHIWIYDIMNAEEAFRNGDSNEGLMQRTHSGGGA